MVDTTLPATMRAQQFSSTKGGIEKNLAITPSAPLPKRKADQHLIKVIAATLNPVDFKPHELPGVTRFFLSKPFTPTIDVVGRVVQPADGSNVKPGQIVFGSAGTLGGALAEYAVVRKAQSAELPEGVDAVWGAAANIAGLTAWQSIVPYVKDGSSVFINGGSGGTGVFGIQVAKARGCYVTTTCSTPNVDLCKSLGADEVIDYRKSNVIEALKAGGRKHDLIVDNVGNDPDLFWKAHEFTNPRARFMMVGAQPSFKQMYNTTAMKLLPSFLGGGQRKHQWFMAMPKSDDLAELAKLMKDGQVKPVIDSKFKFEDAPRAFEKIKTGRAKGKVVVEVDPST